MNTALEYSTRVVQEGGRRCKKSTLNDLVHLTPLRMPLMNPPIQNIFFKSIRIYFTQREKAYSEKKTKRFFFIYKYEVEYINMYNNEWGVVVV